MTSTPLEGLTYQTSSGLTGELNKGSFEYQLGDSVQLFVGDQLVASFDAAAIGNDELITYEEAGFLISREELEQLLAPKTETEPEAEPEAEAVTEAPETEPEPEPEAATEGPSTEPEVETEAPETEPEVETEAPETVPEVEPEVEPDNSNTNEFGIPDDDESDQTGLNDSFIFGESSPVSAWVTATEKVVESNSTDKGWTTQTEQEQSNQEMDDFGNSNGSTDDGSESSACDEQPCGW